MSDVMVLSTSVFEVSWGLKVEKFIILLSVTTNATLFLFYDDLLKLIIIKPESWNAKSVAYVLTYNKARF